MRLSSVLKWIVIVSFAGVVVLWALSWFVGTVALQGPYLVGSAAIVAACSIAALACAACLERGRRRWLMGAGLVACGLSLLGWIAFIWAGPTMSDADVATMARVAGTISIGAAYAMIGGLLSVRRVRKNVAAVLIALATEAAALLLATCAILIIWFPARLDPVGDPVVRLMGILAVLVGFGLLATLILTRLRQLSGDGMAEDEVRLDLEVRCPRCGLRQTFQTGGAECAACGLRIRISVP